MTDREFKWTIFRSVVLMAASVSLLVVPRIWDVPVLWLDFWIGIAFVFLLWFGIDEYRNWKKR